MPVPQSCTGGGQGKEPLLDPLQLRTVAGDSCWVQKADPMEGGWPAVAKQKGRRGGAAVGSPAAQGGDSKCPRLLSPLLAPHQQRATLAHRVHVLA